ncbi:hybrid sensor histidine kinase/response regulator [Cellulophaga tyrosinoxydans]|uniref:histidine kinase n=1 Tax=Cellulophaga tyrosinoxydans TaxID=504486 RepID=A0A1W1Z5G3_9FLAO|nr:ATP-binding protein [Cellulophaga tyrosinoxydans]SMC43665.1 Response regulator receiver domain-containing protein [Cellulophaga tyrosinoxydans]
MLLMPKRMIKNKSKNKFTLRIVLSYFILGALALVSSIFILSEIKSYLSIDTSGKNDTKLIKTGSLLTQLYEAESLSKLALQSKTKENFTAYAQKIDSVSAEIDALKQVIYNKYQLKLLDSVQYLLKRKTYNNEELRRLKLKNEANSSLDIALNKFLKMEASFDKISIYDFNQNPEKLPSYERKILEDWVALLNANVKQDEHTISDPKKADSILAASKKILTEAIEKDKSNQLSLTEKEMEINQNDLDLSQQLRSIIAAFEQEVINATYTDTIKRQDVLNKSIRLAGIAALLGFMVVAFFTFLITRDYWRVQTYRQNLEEEKKFSESLLKSREQLISSVSHDLRTPLNTITGYSELMENTSLNTKQLAYLKNVKSAASYVDNLVNDLLDFSKLEAGKLKTEAIPFMLSDLIHETSHSLKEINKQKPITLTLDIDDKLKSAVIGDPFRVRQILTNLISNAYKFTQEGFINIKATVERNDGNNITTKIQVIDSGIGIEKSKQEDIFKEFTQADEHTERKYGGYGLGLTISKKLTKLLNGTISLDSEKGKGSTFTVVIPFKISKTKIISQPKKAIAPIKSGLSILIIDDDIAMLKLLKEVCESYAITTTTFTNFNEIAKNANLTYDLVLTDIQMPNISGFQVLENFKTGNYTHYVNQPILAMTGRKDLNPSYYLDKGFSEILQKPFSKNDFFNKLAHLFPEVVVMNTSGISEKPSSTSTLYNLETLSSFLGDITNGLQEVVFTFLSDTEENMKILNEAVNAENFESINAVSHRMLSMFRQLQAKDCILLLEEFEHLQRGTISLKELTSKFNILKNNVTALKLALIANELNDNYKSKL